MLTRTELDGVVPITIGRRHIVGVERETLLLKIDIEASVN